MPGSLLLIVVATPLFQVQLQVLIPSAPGNVLSTEFFHCFGISDTYSYFKAYTGFLPDTLRMWNKIVMSDTERSIMAAKTISHHETVV